MSDIKLLAKDDTYEIRNHHNVLLGYIKRNGNYYFFYPRKEYPNFSAHHLEEIAKHLRKLNSLFKLW